MSKAVGKLVLVGEYAVFLHYKILGLGLPFFLEVELKKAEKWTLKAGEYFEIQTLIEHLKNDFPFLNNVFYEITIKSEIPFKAGYGSSSAFSRAFALAFFEKKFLREEEIFAFAKKTEDFFHFMSSGMDVLLSESHQLVTLEKIAAKIDDPYFIPYKKKIFPLPDVDIISISIKRTISAKKIIEKVLTLTQKNKNYRAILDKIGQTGQNFLNSFLKTKDFEKSGIYLNEIHILFQKIGLSHPLIDQMLSIALQNGALGGKLSGAGGGGACFVLSDKKNHSQQILKLWKKIYHEQKENFNCEPFIISP